MDTLQWASKVESREKKEEIIRVPFVSIRGSIIPPFVYFVYFVVHSLLNVRTAEWPCGRAQCPGCLLCMLCCQMFSATYPACCACKVGMARHGILSRQVLVAPCVMEGIRGVGLLWQAEHGEAQEA